MTRYTFDEVQLINTIIEEEHTSKSDFLAYLTELESNTDELDLKNLCATLKEKITELADGRFNSLIESYPVCEFHYY